MRTSEVRAPAGKIDGVNVVGYLETGIGLGEAARGYISALKAAGVPLATRSVRVAIPTDEEDFDVGEGSKGIREALHAEHGDSGGAEEVLNPYSTNLACVNADQMPLFYKEVGETFFEDRRTIGVWGWETNSFPKQWLPSFGLVDELWVYTSHVAQAISRLSPVPVVVVPPPVATPDPTAIGVEDPEAVAMRLGIPEGFKFLFVFDFYSVAERKNPLAVIEAFKRAFTPGEGPQLVLKSIHGKYRPDLMELLETEARDRVDIHVVDRYVSLKEKTALMAGSDCYVSLHRAEGFGLTLAEAMALGKPVIATGYSGNMDFMSTSNSYPVDYTMVEIGEGIPPYSEGGGSWAEPDLDHAVGLMRRVWENQDEARERGEHARLDVERMLSAEAVGKIARARLEQSAWLPIRPKVPPLTVPLEDTGRESIRYLRSIESMLKQGPAVESPSKLGRLGKLARRMVLRGMSQFSFYQRQLDSALIEALKEESRQSVEALRETRQSIEAVYLNLARGQVQLEKQVHARNEELERRIEELGVQLRRLEARFYETQSNSSEEAKKSEPLAEPDNDDYHS